MDTLDDATASFVFVTFTTNTPSLFVLGFVTVITALLYAPFSVGLNVPEVASPSTYTTSTFDDAKRVPVTCTISPDVSSTNPLSYTS